MKLFVFIPQKYVKGVVAVAWGTTARAAAARIVDLRVAT